MKLSTLLLALLLSVPGDVVPAPFPDSVVDIRDVVTNLRRAVGLEEPRWPERKMILDVEQLHPFLSITAKLPWEWSAEPPTRIDCAEGGRFLQWYFEDVSEKKARPWLSVTCEWDELQEGDLEPMRVYYRGSHPIGLRQPGIPPPDGVDYVPTFPWIEVYLFDDRGLPDPILGFGTVRAR